MKRIIFAFALISILFLGGCSSTSKTMKAIEGKDGVFAIMETSKGSIALELYYKETPLTVTNFVGLAEGTLDATDGMPFYDGLNFHRVINNFMIQGGDPNGNGTGGPGYKFVDEIVDSLTHNGPGVLSMANSGPNTNGSQFFITHVETPWLDGKHTVFGRVLAGQEVVDSVEQGDKIEKVTIIRQGTEAEAFTANQEDFDSRLKVATALAEEKRAAEIAKQRAALEARKNFVEKVSSEGIKTKENIIFMTTKEGSGEKCGAKKSVAVNYTGYFLDGRIFDTSEGRGLLGFQTGRHEMIEGFDLMVQDMKLGEKRTAILPADMAYGDVGAGGGIIPGGATIVFDIELVNIR